jgi:hypothetical protein
MLNRCVEMKRRNPLKIKGLRSEAAGTRTRDQRIKSPLLYQLSYSPKSFSSNDLRTLIEKPPDLESSRIHGRMDPIRPLELNCQIAAKAYTQRT